MKAFQDVMIKGNVIESNSQSQLRNDATSDVKSNNISFVTSYMKMKKKTFMACIVF